MDQGSRPEEKDMPAQHELHTTGEHPQKKGLKISEQNDLSHRPASKQANAMQTTRHPQQRAKKGRP